MQEDKEEKKGIQREKESEEEKQMEKQLKQRLENIPRFSYKTVRFFEDKKQMQNAIDDLMNNNIMNLNSKTLTRNFIQEVYDMSIFTAKEGIYTLIGAVIGGVIGAIIGMFHGKSIISLPLLNPISAGGTIMSTILCFFIGAVLVSTAVAIIMLYKPIKNIKMGYCMLTVYSSIEDKQNIDNYLKKYNPIQL